MTKINLFLQKIKMHESHHGIIMVIFAYAISFLLLILGSDVFYNIKSAAAGKDYVIEEETEEIVKQETFNQETFNQETLTPRSMSSETLVLQSSLVNPYGLEETSKPEVLGMASQLALTSGINYYGQAENMNYIEQRNNASALADKTEAIESLSVADEVSPAFSNVTKKEVEMLQRIVEAEASGEDMVGKILIANVVLNRIEDDEFPDSIEKVIFQKVEGSYQFSPILDKRYWTVTVSDDTEEAVKRVLEGEDYSDGALYFMNRIKTKHSTAAWFDNKLEWLFKHGGHEFYRNN